jgi:hypothetical protein
VILAALCCFSTGVRAAQNKVPRGDPSSEARPQGEHRERPTYESWIRDYLVGPLTGALGFEQREIKLVITVVEGDDVETDAKTAAIFGPSYRIAFHGCAVAIDVAV